jgi:hypothetical protein
MRGGRGSAEICTKHTFPTDAALEVRDEVLVAAGSAFGFIERGVTPAVGLRDSCPVAAQHFNRLQTHDLMSFHFLLYSRGM